MLPSLYLLTYELYDLLESNTLMDLLGEGEADQVFNLLLETGDNFLLEDGSSFILLE